MQKIKTYRKPNGDLNLDIDSVVKQFPEIAGARCDDEEQKAISVALVPYIIKNIEITQKEVSKVLFLMSLFILTNTLITIALISIIIWRF